MKKIAILASGNGSNAENIVRYFVDRQTASVAAIFSNKRSAYVLERARSLGVEAHVFSKAELMDGHLASQLKNLDIDYVVLAGFLLLIPPSLIKTYEHRIINIHPSLLPKHGGKGMYGSKVHESVIREEDKVSGITIHLVNEVYDQGKVLFQAEVDVLADDTPELLAEKIHQLEYVHYPKVIEHWILNH